MAKAEIKRFYERVRVMPNGAGFTVCLDDKPLKTPAGALVLVSHKGLAAALAAEWDNQGERFDPQTLALTQTVNSGLDHVGAHREKIVAELARFGQSDLICYRADGPEALVQREDQYWQPLLDWARDVLRAPLKVGAGVQPILQPAESMEALRKHIAHHEDISLAALHQAVSLCGSVIIGLALSFGHLTEQEAWAAAQVDENWQLEQWGHDDEAKQRAQNRQAGLSAAAFVLEICRA